MSKLNPEAARYSRLKQMLSYPNTILERDKFLSEHEASSNFRGKIILQCIVSISFLILSVTNVFEESYIMLAFTLAGFVINGFFASLAFFAKNVKICTHSSIIVCSVVFTIFVISGGNDGFAALWITLLPVFAMAIMDLVMGFIASVFIQFFLIAVLRTPLCGILLYDYNEQFRLRFPLFFFVTFMLGFVMTLTLQKSRFIAQTRLTELQKVTEIANRLAKSDPLTGLANRRCAYEIFEKDFSDESISHTVVMGDIDKFKTLNDTYGHEFGDEVLVTVAKYITEVLPENHIKSRWGGEEFLIAANEPLDTVFEVIEALRVKVSEHKFTCNDENVKVTLTFGVAEYSAKSELNAAIKAADERLYLGKNTTRNCTVKA